MLDDQQICAAIDKASLQSVGVDDVVADERRKAYEYYFGEAEGDLAPSTIPNRSKVVSRDLLECVEWAMPALMEIFAASDDIVKFEPDSEPDTQSAMDATNYVGYLIHRKQEDAFQTIHDSIKSALLTASGPGKCYVETSQEERPERYERLTESELATLRKDPEVDVTEETPAGFDQPDPMAPPVPLFDVLIMRREQVQIFRNEAIPPEELRVPEGTRRLHDVPFIEHRRRVTLSYLLEQGYPAELVEQLSTDEARAADEDEDARDENGDEDRYEAPDPAQRQVWLSEAYMRLDVAETGKTKFWRFVKADNVLFEKDETDDHCFWYFTPILMPYKLRGLSFYQLLKELQKIKTTLERQGLDNLYLMNNPRTEVVVKQVMDMNTIISPRIGGHVPVTQLGALREVPVTPVLGAVTQMMQVYDQRRDSRTGVTEMNSAMNGESLSQTNVGSMGVQALMNAGSQRLKLIARVLAETGFKRMYYLMLKNVVQHQNRPQQMQINGRWLTIDPREWKNKYNMTVSVGTGSFGRTEAVANLRQLGAMQKELAPLGLVKPLNIYNTAKRVIEQMGYRDVEQFVNAPDDPNAPMPAPQGQPDPTAGLVQAEQVKAQALLQKAAMDNEARLTIEREKIASEERVAMFRAQQDRDLQREKMQLEAALRPSPVLNPGEPANATQPPA